MSRISLVFSPISSLGSPTTTAGEAWAHAPNTIVADQIEQNSEHVHSAAEDAANVAKVVTIFKCSKRLDDVSDERPRADWGIHVGHGTTSGRG